MGWMYPLLIPVVLVELALSIVFSLDLFHASLVGTILFHGTP